MESPVALYDARIFGEENMSVKTESRVALHELIALLQEIDTRWAGEEWNLHSADDVTAAHRALMHLLDGGVGTMFESNPAAPVMQRIVTPTRKFTGDNSDAIYFDDDPPDALAAALRDRGHAISAKRKTGVVQAILVNGSQLIGIADPRKGGTPAGY